MMRQEGRTDRISYVLEFVLCSHLQGDRRRFRERRDEDREGASEGFLVV